MRGWTACALIMCWLLKTDASAQAVISELMAANETTSRDDFGEFSDWIEIHNPTGAPVNLDQWGLTDNAANLVKWRFPAVTLAPGEFLVVRASNRDLRVSGAPLHTNFALSKDGEYLALVRPDGVTVEHEFAPAFPALRVDESYGLRFDSTVLVAEGDMVRYRAPDSASSPPADWMTAAYNDSGWAQGPSGLGFGLLVPGMTVRQVFKNSSMGGLADAANLVLLPDSDPQVLGSATVVLPMLNILGEGSDGNYGANDPPPGGFGDNYAIRATGKIEIATAGTYTFGLNSDDGGRIRINGSNVMVDDTFHGPQNFFGTISLGVGIHDFEVIMFEGGGGDCVEFFAAPGNLATFDPGAFRLVGDVANGGLPAMTVPDGSGDVIATNLQSAMGSGVGAYFRVPITDVGEPATALSLVMRQNDGFAAYLNGTPVASANAPENPMWNSPATGERPDSSSLQRTGYNVTSALGSLADANPVLAIHGMRSSASDPSFLMLPELISGILDPLADPALYSRDKATPGWINGVPSSLGVVADTKFSINRGIYTDPITVGITSETVGAIIRFTTDGSTPDGENGTTYTVPLEISTTTVLRAIATKEDYDPTNVDTQTYIFPNDVLVQSSDGSPPPGWPSSSGTSQVMDYGMDPEIVNHTNPAVGGNEEVRAALLALPSVSITTDLPNLLNIDGSRGIYANPHDRGFGAERPASLEWINPPTDTDPNGTNEFQIDAGLRVRGGFSRSTNNPKHALRFLFRGDYGAAKLNYPLFGDQGADKFDKIDFRTSQNYSWSFGGDSQNTFLREESSRLAQLDMGQPGSRVRYVHVYLNGQYWGLFDTDERTDADHAAAYFGGDKADHDVVKAEQESGYSTGVVDGTINAWRDLWDLGKVHRANPSNANYFRMQGLAPDGATPTEDPVLLDADNLIDYLLLTFWMGNLDGATSAFLGNDRANNWSGTRQRVNNPRQGFRFFVHDFEHTMFNPNEDRTGPYPSTNESNFSFSNPLFLHQDLTGNAEYRMRWADRVHRHLFDDGVLTAQAWEQRVNSLAAVIDRAIIAESARWGDAKTSSPRTRLDWLNAKQAILNYLPQRGPIVLGQLRADGLYPSINAPVITPHGGSHPTGTEVVAAGPAGATLYYMPDGTDPRAVGGALRPAAQIYVSSVTGSIEIPWSASGWKYNSSGNDLGTAWREAGYSDSGWAVGRAELGYGDSDEETVIPIVEVSPGQKVATTYFRRTFGITGVDEIVNLTLRVKYDDAYAVYINGQRVAGNLPVDPSYDYYSGSAIEDTIEQTVLSAGWLQEGENTLAIEVHQASGNSSDLSMNLSLTATRQAEPSELVLSDPGRRTIRMRARSGATWSAMAESHYEVGMTAPDAGNLVVSEISYHPPDPHGNAEFIELLNASSDLAIDLAGSRFTHGVDFTFPAGSLLLPGARTLVIRNQAAFETLYGPGFPIAGIFENNTALSNGGERLRLEAPDGSTLFDLTYGPAFPWPGSANDGGRTMVLTDPSQPENPESWRPSVEVNGNPNASDSIPLTTGQDLVAYALQGPPPTIDPLTGQFSATRVLGADAVDLVPEWSGNLVEWSSQSLMRISEIPDGQGGSRISWQLDPLPQGRAFLRLRISEKD